MVTKNPPGAPQVLRVYPLPVLLEAPSPARPASNGEVEAQYTADTKLSCTWTVGFIKFHNIIALCLLAPDGGDKNNLTASAAGVQKRTKTS